MNFPTTGATFSIVVQLAVEEFPLNRISPIHFLASCDVSMGTFDPPGRLRLTGLQ